VRVLLFASLGLNVAVLGIVAGALLDPDRRTRGLDGADIAFGPFTQVLADEDRSELRRAFTGRLPDFRRIRQSEREAMVALAEVLRADPADPAAIGAALDRMGAGLQTRIDLGRELLAERLVAMPAARRVALADRIEDMMRRRRPPDRREP
jgi:uncharacterized membrane protein